MREWIALLNAKSWLAKQKRDLTQGKAKTRFVVYCSQPAVFKPSHFSRFHSDWKASIRFSPVRGNARFPWVTKPQLVNTK